MRKRLALVLSMLILAAGGPTLAQTGASTPAARHPGLRDRLKDLDQKIREDESAGRIDRKKARDLRNKVNQARSEMMEDIRANGKKPLTDEQAQKIGDKLDRIAPQL